MDSNNIDVTESTQEGVSRRTIVKIGAWSVPAVAAGFAVPAAAASPSEEGPSLPEAVAEFGVGLNGGRGTLYVGPAQWNADKTVFYTQYGPSMHVRLKVGTQPLPAGTIITFTFKPLSSSQEWLTDWTDTAGFWDRGEDTPGAGNRRAYFNRPATSVVGATTTTMAQSDVPAGTVIDFLVGSIVNPTGSSYPGGKFSATITLPSGETLTLPANGLADSDGTDFTYETFKGAYLYQEAHQAVTSPGDITSLVMQVKGPGYDHGHNSHWNPALG